ncbi:MAG: hypothetical protein MR902_02670 [Campylobacter sp.]|nr:hypothetical protein [Campylobacter sp.]
MNELSFIKVEQILPFFHIFLVTIFISIHFCLISILLVFLKFPNTKRSLKFLLKIFSAFIISCAVLFTLIILSGAVLSMRESFEYSYPMIEGILVTKVILSFFILINFGYIIYRFYRLKNSILKNELDEIDEHIIIASKYFLPLNIAMSVLTMFLSVSMKGF